MELVTNRTDGAGINEEGDALGFDDVDFFFDFKLNNEDLSLFFDNVDDVRISPVETLGETTVSPTQPTHVDSQVLNDGPNIVRSSFEAMSSSAPRGSLTLQHAHDESSEWLDKFLAREGVDPAHRGKEISIGAGSPDKEELMIFKLKEEMGVLNQKLIERDVLIGTLDIRVSKLEKKMPKFKTSNKLITEFGDKFKKTSVSEPNEVGACHCAPAQVTQVPQDASELVRTTHVVDHLETEPAQIIPRVTLMQAQNQVSTQRKENMLFMKNSYKNVRGEQPQLSVTELGNKRFKDGSLHNMEYWAYDEATATAVMKFHQGVFHRVEAMHLLKFGEHDIRTLAEH
ncbi:unnamed protein product [Lactuca saligna]|uniref:Uncharacterized protein n=1 Tax=Lactuca saligna TaxID=75948 RepID=A0AA35Z3R8_LACSI|nr:unnamed protein product [Lactuca saligna]